MFLLSGSALISWSLPRDSITPLGNTTVPAESIKRAAEENTVVAIPTVIVFLETPVRSIPLTFIAEWLT
jgi:hypothetical protein